MPFWPVAAREARAAARAPRTYAWRAAVTAIGIAMVPISLWASRTAPSQGRAVFIGVGAMAFIYCLFGGVLRTADTIAEEKRENTLGLLFLTDLRVGDVISGKLLASTATLFFGLLALLPLLTIPVLLGGVTSRDLIRMALCLLNSLFFSISLGFLISTFFRQGWVTISVALGSMLGMVLFVPFVAGNFIEPIRSTLNAFSPATMFGAIIYGLVKESSWQSFAVIHCLAWLGLLCSAHYLPKYWQERPHSRRAQLRWEFFRRLRLGGDATRKRFRTRLLNRNPLFWLSGREQVSSLGLMGFLMFLVAVSLAGDWSTVLIGLVSLHATLLIRMSSAASHALAEDRKSGALELLLATSLSVREVLKGRWMALGRQFFGPMLIVSIWHLFTVLWLGVMSPYPTLPLTLFVGWFGIVFSWIATGWFGMWMGLRARHPIAAIWATVARVVLLPWIVMVGIFSILAFFQLIPDYGFPGQHNFEIIGFFIWGLYLFALNAWTARRVKNAFREAATDRFNDTQPIDWRPFWRATWKVSVATVLIIAIVWSTRAFINYRGERALARVLAAHPNFSLEEPAPTFIPNEQNLARWDFLNALTSPLKIDRNKYQHVGGLGGWRSGGRYVLPNSAHPGAPELEEDEKELLRLHAAARERPMILFTPPQAPGPMGPFDPYNFVHQIPARLAGRAERRLLAGEHPIDDILLALRFANSVSNDASALTARAHMAKLIIQPIYDGILDGRWSDSDLQTIQRAFEQSDARPQLEAWRHHVIRQVSDTISNKPRMTNPFGPMYGFVGNTPFYLGAVPNKSPLPGKIQSRQAEFIEAGLAWKSEGNLQRPNWGNLPGGSDEFKRNLFQMLHYSLNEGMRNLAPLQTAIDEVVVACAIERFRVANGELPTVLGELTPKYLSKIPNDVVSGGPLKYRLTNDGYLLYSVGADGEDDKGMPEISQMTKGRQTMQRGDWVWIYKK